MTEQTDIHPVEAQEAEAADEGFINVVMAGYDGRTKEVRAIPATRWRASALRALNGGDIDGFMEKVLHEDDFDVYIDLDPDATGVGEFAQAVSAKGGEPLGKSNGPRPSSRRTRKR